MRKTSYTTLIAAGLLAAFGTAQAAATGDAPLGAGEASTMTNGQPNSVTTNSPYPDGTVVLHSYSYPAVVTAHPGYYVPVQVGSLPRSEPLSIDGSDASPTSNVPTNAGEASTMTNGVPNLVTRNNPSWPVAQVVAVPHYPPYGYVWQR